MSEPFISWSRFWRSFRYARQGLRRALVSENSFRIHVVVAILVIAAMFIVQLSRIEIAIVVLVMSTILTLELVNTIVERFVGLLEPRVHPYVGIIKDLMAAAVLITTVAAIIIGFLVFWPA